jgi:hypothetical protein
MVLAGLVSMGSACGKWHCSTGVAQLLLRCCWIAWVFYDKILGHKLSAMGFIGTVVGW